MADTVRASYPTTPCSDCHTVGEVYIKHWGPLVPPGETGFFCPTCMATRVEDNNHGREVRQLGIMATVESAS